MCNVILSLFLLATSFCAFSQSDIVQGPFRIDGNNTIYIKSENDISYPLALYIENGDKSLKIDSYEVDGDNPHVDTVFFAKLKNKKNVVVLVSWHQLHSAEKISGHSYKIYGYEYSNGHLTINPLINADPELNGLDGEFNGELLHFKYKDAATIKKYLNEKYNQTKSNAIGPSRS